MQNKRVLKSESLKFTPKPGVRAKYRREGKLAIVTVRGTFSYHDSFLPKGLVRRTNTEPKVQYVDRPDPLIKGSVYKDTVFYVEIEGWNTDWTI